MLKKISVCLERITNHTLLYVHDKIHLASNAILVFVPSFKIFEKLPNKGLMPATRRSFFVGPAIGTCRNDDVRLVAVGRRLGEARRVIRLFDRQGKGEDN